MYVFEMEEVPLEVTSTATVPNESWWTGDMYTQYLSEIELYQRALLSPYRTRNRTEANLFWVPHFQMDCLRSTSVVTAVTTATTTTPTTHTMEEEKCPEAWWVQSWWTYRRWLEKQPEWTCRTFVWLWSNEYMGPPMDDMTPPKDNAALVLASSFVFMNRVAKGLPPRGTTQMQRIGWDIQIPYTMGRLQDRWTNRSEVLASERDRILFFQGRMEPMFAERHRVAEFFREDPRYTFVQFSPYVDVHTNGTGEKEVYNQHMLHHRFCLAGAGSHQDSRRGFECMMAGCIPVYLVADGIPFQLPFEDVVDYDSFALFLPSGGDLFSLKEEMENMSHEELRRRQVSMERFWSIGYLGERSSQWPDMWDYVEDALRKRVRRFM